MLINLINDLLDLAKQNEFTFKFHKTYFNLEDTIKETFKTLEYLAQKQKIILDLQIEPGTTTLFRHVYGDPNRYQQVLINLISNALKFTGSNGTVKVTLVLEKAERCA